MSEPQFYATETECNYYFGSKLIKNINGWVYSDRLASIGKFYPYGIERTSPIPPNGTEKFTGDFRDAESGNDYAVNRYMTPGNGRFITPDRGTGGAKPSNPGTWNLYAYVAGDPINFVDPHGHALVFAPVPGGSGGGGAGDDDDDDDDDDGGGGSGGGGGCFGGNGLLAQPGPLCPPVGGPPPQKSPTPPRPRTVITLKEIGDCIYPNGAGGYAGFTLEVEYQVLVNRRPQPGNPPTVSESVQSPGNKITGNGVWCTRSSTCSTAGSMMPNGSFWDALGGNFTASQTFYVNGQAVPVINFPGSPTTLSNVYNSANQMISVSNGAVVGNSQTRLCGTLSGDEAPN
jgi:RHS repeat-associated protein